MKLTRTFKISYGFSEVVTNLVLFMCLSYEMVFLTEVCGINTYLSGIIMTGGSVLDAASVFVLGPLIERSRFRWGRYRSWLLICFPVAVFFALLFSDFTTVLPKGAATVVVYLLLHAVYAITVNILYITRYNFNASLTSDDDERMALSRLRQGGAAIGSFAGGYLYLGMIYRFGGADVLTAGGFFWTAVVLGAALIGGYMVLFRVSRDYANTGIHVLEDGSPEQVNTLQLYRYALREKSLIYLMLAEFFRFLSKSMLLTLAPLFFQYVTGDLDRWSVYYSFSAIAVMFGAIAAGPLSRIFSIKKVYISCVLTSACLFCLMLAFSGNAVMAIVCAIAGNLLLAPTDVLYTVVTGQINDDIVSKHGSSACSIVNALMSLSCEIAYLVSYSICNFGLGLAGYQPGCEITPTVILGIKYIAIGLPALALIVAAVCAFGFPRKAKTV